MGQSRRFDCGSATSGLPPRTDIVRSVGIPEAVVRSSAQPLVANKSQRPGRPLSSKGPRSAKFNPVPATRSVTTRDTSTSSEPQCDITRADRTHLHAGAAGAVHRVASEPAHHAGAVRGRHRGRRHRLVDIALSAAAADCRRYDRVSGYESNTVVSTARRSYYWRKSIGFIADAPLFGHGYRLDPAAIRPRSRRPDRAVGRGGQQSAQPDPQCCRAICCCFRGDGLAAWIGLVIVVQTSSARC